MTEKYSIEYLPIAQKDLEEIIQYIQKDNSGAVANFLAEFDRTVSKLEEFPLMGQVPWDRRLEPLGYRLLVVGNYLVFYVVEDETVEIRRILHGRRKYSFLLHNP